jgi:hypothetical protein
MSIAAYHYASEHGFGKLKPQKRFKRKIKFRPVDLVRPDAFYLFSLEQMLCIFHAFFATAAPFFEEGPQSGLLGGFFGGSWRSGSRIFTGGYREAMSSLGNHLAKLMLGVHGNDLLWQWRESMGFTGDMSGFVKPMELPCPPYYTARRTMPIPAFSSFGDCYNKVFAPKMKKNKKTSRTKEAVERFFPVTRKGQDIGKPFVREKGVAIATYKPKELGYYFLRIDYAYDTCKGCCWSFYVRSKPNQTFVDFVIELSNIYDRLSRSRSPVRYLKPVNENETIAYCEQFYING